MPHIDNFPLIASAIILVAAYFLVVTEWIHRAALALVGAGLVVALGLLDQAGALHAIDFNTIGLLAGMMIVVAIARKSGMFEYAAIRTAQAVRASPAGILTSLALVTAVLSAFLNNVTCVLLIVPITFAVCRELKVSPYPFLFSEIVASNIGGTATLIGDPPNIMIGSATGLSFNDFLLALAPPIAVVMAVQLLISHIVWGRWMKASGEDKARIMAMQPKAAIKDRYLLICSLAVMGAAIAAFVFADALGLGLASIAMMAAATLMVLENFSHPRHRHGANVNHALREIDWVTLFFFMGLFIVVGAVEHAGLLRILGAKLMQATGGDPRLTGTMILWASAVLSAIVDNIPFVATMIPLIKGIAPALGGADHIQGIWWALALGACLGGNGTLVGSAANLAVAGLAEKNGVAFSFTKFTLAAFPMMLVSIAICYFYLMWRYF